MKTNLISITLILLFSILVSLPLLKSGLYLMHDDQQVARLFLFDQSLKSSQIPVRWVSELGFGFGYPLFNFYPPFAYMLGEIFHLVHFDYINSVKLVFFSSIFFSAVAMYIFVKDLWGRFAATISALFYLMVPYHAIDVYIRGAMAESLSFVWLPLILWTFYRLYTKQKAIYIYASAVFLALLMVTHNLIFLPFMMLLPIYLIFLTSRSENPKKFIVYSLMSIVFSFLLSAFFWIPALVEKKYTIVDKMLLTNLADFRIHFVYPQQLWDWTWGFGGSTEGLNDGISFKIGKLHILVSVAAFVLGVIRLTKTKLETKTGSQVLPIVIFLLFLFSAFMATSYSKFIWEFIKPLAYLQFPWRFLTFTALFSSILAGALIYHLRLSILRIIVVPILIATLIFFNFKLFRPREYRTNLTDETATSADTISWNVSKTSFEYAPKGIDLYADEKGINMINLTKTDIPHQKLELLTGNVDLHIKKTSPSAINFNAQASQDFVIKANIFNFPGWQVKIDGQNTEIDDNNSLKLITFKVPKGYHEISVQFKNTPVRTTANLISLLSLILLTPILAIKWPIQTKN